MAPKGGGMRDTIAGRSLRMKNCECLGESGFWSAQSYELLSLEGNGVDSIPADRSGDGSVHRANGGADVVGS